MARRHALVRRAELISLLKRSGGELNSPAKCPSQGSRLTVDERRDLNFSFPETVPMLEMCFAEATLSSRFRCSYRDFGYFRTFPPKTL